MKRKKCSKCKKTKALSKFTKKRTSSDGYNARCSDCTRAVSKEHYEANKPLYIKKARKSNDRVRAWFKELKRGLKCERCPETHPSCLEFHHRDPKTKSFMVGALAASGYSRPRILKEIKKCNVLCANCHRKEHW